MKRIYLLATLIFLLLNNVFCQDFLGINTGNYAGITGVMLQPASIVDSRYKFDINLISAGVNYSNNYLLVDRSALLKFNSKNFSDYQTFKSKYLSEAGLAANEKAWANINNRIQMPLSFMVTLGPKSAIALNMQSRTIVQGRNIPGDLAKMAYDGFTYDPTANPVLNASGFNVHALNWAEIGLTYGRVLISNKKHFLKAAFTGKYLGGIASAYVGSDNISFGINPDSSLNFNTARTEYSHSKTADFSNSLGNIFKNPDASSFGFDAGIVYEFRGNIDRLEKVSKDDQVAYLSDRRDANKYMFKVGVSILDAGMFNFTKPDNVNSFSSTVVNWRVRDEHFNSVKQFDTALASRVSAFPNDPQNYKVHLPTALSVQLDMRFVKGLYLNVMAYRPLKLNNSDGYRFDNYGYYTVTPRWETRRFGIYIPYTFAKDIGDYKSNLLGASFRFGSFFIGSSNLGTMAFNKQLRSADIYAGLKFGITYGKSTKASRLLEKIRFTKPAAVIVSVDSSSLVKARMDSLLLANALTKSVNTAPQLLVDYKNGQVFSVPNQTGNVVIINNNNYYYGTAKDTSKTDTAIISKTIVQTDSLRLIYDSSKLIKRDPKADSLQRRMQDSLNRKKAQLDSLIRNLEQLRKSMDSSGAYKARMNGDTSGLALYQADSIAYYNYANREIARLNIPPTVMDTLINRNIITRHTDSTVALSPTVEALKKKTDPTYPDSLVVVQNIISPAPQPQAAPQYYAPAPEAVAYNNDLRRQREQDLRNYTNKANSLQADIRDLQQRIGRQRRNRTDVIPIYAGEGREKTIIKLDGKDTVFIRDTLVVKDTIYIRDTLRAAALPSKTDTLLNTIILQADTVFIPIEKEKIIKASVDYNKQPATIILFDLNKTNIKKVYYNRLDYVAGLLTKDPLLKATISGHTDKTGTVKANEIVSLKRADIVRDYLLKKGVQNSQMSILTFSDTQPVAEGNSKAADSQNRRVEIKLGNASN